MTACVSQAIPLSFIYYHNYFNDSKSMLEISFSAFMQISMCVLECVGTHTSVYGEAVHCKCKSFYK